MRTLPAGRSGRRAAERLRRQVMGADGSLGHPYFRGLGHQFRGTPRTGSLDDLAEEAARARIVYVGDFHALPDHQRFAGELLARIASRRPRLALGVEFVYTRQQRWLDRRQDGSLTDDEFLRRIHYRDEWGYPWAGYRELLDRARDTGVPVYALDVPPRRGFGGLARRDDHAARRIVAILRAEARRNLIVLFGESHVTRGHLPRRVAVRSRRADIRGPSVTVFQTPDRIYWNTLESGGRLPEAIRYARATWAVFPAGPLEKYEAYRQVLERWSAELPPDEEIDLTPAVHHLLEVLLRAIGVRAEARRVRHRAGWSEELADAFPEVYGGAEAGSLLGPIMAEHGRSGQEIRDARRRFEQLGALYESRSNTLFLDRYLPAAAAAEGARFLRAALTGRLFIAAEDFRGDPALATYGAAYTEALALLGAKLVDPTGETESGAGEDRDPALEAWVERHRQFERSRRIKPPDELLGALRDSRPLRRRIARGLGRRLGLRLVQRVREGSLGPAGLRRLFSAPLEPGKAAARVLRLLRQP